MRSAHSVEQVRAAESELLARLPEGDLMSRAASGLATAVIDLLGGVYGRRVLLLVGSGDNGGDALYAGALLARRGAGVEAVLLSERVHTGGVTALRRAGGTTYAADGWAAHTEFDTDYDVAIDGIVGIGGRPGLRPEAVATLAALDGVPMVAVDVPSGVDVDTGEISGPHVSADLTVTFGTHKTCHFVDPAATHCGVVTLVDLDLELPTSRLEAFQAEDVAALVPRPMGTDHKYTRGVIGLRTGAGYAGAGLLSTAGAASGLSGMVRYIGPEATADMIRTHHPEIVFGGGRVQAWVVGSGGGEGAAAELTEALDDGVPVVVDADALTHVQPGTPDLILTPHAGELGRMLGIERAEIEARGLHWAREAARHYGAVVLLKGRHTLVATPDGRTRVTTSGTPWLATAGAGDVLAGLIGALAAAGLKPFDAASVGSWLHGSAATLVAHGAAAPGLATWAATWAGEDGSGPVTAGEVARAIPAVIRQLATTQRS